MNKITSYIIILFYCSTEVYDIIISIDIQMILVVTSTLRCQFRLPCEGNNMNKNGSKTAHVAELCSTIK